MLPLKNFSILSKTNKFANLRKETALKMFSFKNFGVESDEKIIPDMEFCIEIEETENNNTTLYTNNAKNEKRGDEINGIKVFTYEDESSDSETVIASEGEAENEVALIPTENDLRNEQCTLAAFEEVVIQCVDEEAQIKEEPRITWRSLPYWKQLTDAQHFKVNTTISCADCKKNFNYWTFLNHIRFVHYEKLKFCCDVCNKYFINREELSKHRNIHNIKQDAIQPKVYMCSECARAYVTTSELLNHIRFSHTFVCIHTGCNRWYRSRSARDEHSRTHVYKEVPKLIHYSFGDCENNSNSDHTNLNTNLNEVIDHLSETNQSICSIENKNTSSSESTPAIIKTIIVADKTKAVAKESMAQNNKIQTKLADDDLSENLNISKRKHLKRKQINSKVDDVSDKKILKESSSRISSTTNCKKTIIAERISKPSLATKKHSKIKSSTNVLKIDAENSSISCLPKVPSQSINRLQCTKCLEISSSDKQFQLHLKKHVSSRPHTCKVCSKTYLIFNELLKHMKTHSKELPFYCEKCFQRFRLKATLLVHMDRHKQPVICEICSKGFKKIERLSEHMLSHL